MSRHEGVSCDACMAGNFGGRRFKCLVCFDFDLCGTCHDAGQTGSSHDPTHATQCILTRDDYELYYGGEGYNPEQVQSLTCPLCAELGFSSASLPAHVAERHAGEASASVICPICAAVPNGDPNRMTAELGEHLATWHVPDDAARDPAAARGRRSVGGSRAPQRTGAVRGRGAARGYGLTSQLLAQPQAASYQVSGGGSEAGDPISELLSQLGGMRRPNANYSSTLAQIQQLQQQLGRGSASSTSTQRRALVGGPAAAAAASSEARAAGSLHRTFTQALWDDGPPPPPEPATVRKAAVFGAPPTRESELLLPRLEAETWRAAEARVPPAEVAARREILAELLMDSLARPLEELQEALPPHLRSTPALTSPAPAKKNNNGQEKVAVVQPVVASSSSSRPTAMVAPHPSTEAVGRPRVASVPPVNVVANPVSPSDAARAPATGVVIGIPAGHDHYAVVSTPQGGTRMSRTGATNGQERAASNGSAGGGELLRGGSREPAGPTPV